MSRTLNVGRMRRYRERTAARTTCETCRDLFRRMDAIEPYTVARFAVGVEHFAHVTRDHPAST